MREILQLESRTGLHDPVEDAIYSIYDENRSDDEDTDMHDFIQRDEDTNSDSNCNHEYDDNNNTHIAKNPNHHS